MFSRTATILPLAFGVHSVRGRSGCSWNKMRVGVGVVGCRVRWPSPTRSPWRCPSSSRTTTCSRTATHLTTGRLLLPPSLPLPLLPAPYCCFNFLIFFSFSMHLPPLPHKFPQVANPTVINFGLSQMKSTGSAVEVPQCKGDNHFLQVKSISWSKMLTFDFVVVVL